MEWWLNPDMSADAAGRSWAIFTTGRGDQAGTRLGSSEKGRGGDGTAHWGITIDTAQL